MASHEHEQSDPRVQVPVALGSQARLAGLRQRNLLGEGWEREHIISV